MAVKSTLRHRLEKVYTKDKRKLPLQMIPYYGKAYEEKYTTGDKPFNGNRNIMIVDVCMEVPQNIPYTNFFEERYYTCSVKTDKGWKTAWPAKLPSFAEYAEKDNGSFCLKHFLESIDNFVDKSQILYHSFFVRPFPKFKQPLERFSPPEQADYNVQVNNKNYFDASNRDLEESFSVFRDVINVCKPDIIIVIGLPLYRAIKKACINVTRKELDSFWDHSKIKSICLEGQHYFKGTEEFQDDPILKTDIKDVKNNEIIEFLENECFHRHYSAFMNKIRSIRASLYWAKECAKKESSRYDEYSVSYYKGSNAIQEGLSDGSIVKATEICEPKPIKFKGKEIPPSSNIEYWHVVEDLLVVELNIAVEELKQLEEFGQKFLSKTNNYFQNPEKIECRRDGRVRKTKKT